MANVEAEVESTITNSEALEEKIDAALGSLGATEREIISTLIAGYATTYANEQTHALRLELAEAKKAIDRATASNQRLSEEVKKNSAAIADLKTAYDTQITNAKNAIVAMQKEKAEALALAKKCREKYTAFVTDYHRFTQSISKERLNIDN